MENAPRAVLLKFTNVYIVFICIHDILHEGNFTERNNRVQKVKN